MDTARSAIFLPEKSVDPVRFFSIFSLILL